MTTETLEDREVWFCPNGEWVDWYTNFHSCGALCGIVQYKELPDWAKQELATLTRPDDD
jgi:hypothetical protein